MERPAYLLEFEKPLRELEKQLESLHQQSLENNIDMSAELSAIEEKLEQTKREIYTESHPLAARAGRPPPKTALRPRLHRLHFAGLSGTARRPAVQGRPGAHRRHRFFRAADRS